MKVHDSIHIDADRARVFDVFRDLDTMADHIEGIAKIEILEGSGQMSHGTKWRETRTMFGKEATEEMWVTGIEQGASYTVEAESRGTHYRSEYLFTSEGGGTRVDMTFEGRPLTFGARVFGLIGVLFLGATKKAFHKDMVDLKRVCEAA